MLPRLQPRVPTGPLSDSHTLRQVPGECPVNSYWDPSGPRCRHGGTHAEHSGGGGALPGPWLTCLSHNHCPREGTGHSYHPGPQLHLTPAVPLSWTLIPRLLPQGDILVLTTSHSQGLPPSLWSCFSLDSAPDCKTQPPCPPSPSRLCSPEPPPDTVS